MRLWSLHPRHLDRIGLVACWREALLAQAVLAEQTKGYRQHPQLQRFRESSSPMDAVGGYLTGLRDEADARGFRFNVDKILRPTPPAGLVQLTVTTGQLEHEWRHLGAKLEARSPAEAARWREDAPSAHPLFSVLLGVIEPWERP